MKATLIFLIFTLFFFFQNLNSQTPDIFISSWQKDAIGRYDGETGEFLGNFAEGGGLDRPQKILFHPNTGHALVTGFLNSEIKMYDGETGAYLGNFSSGYSLNSPTKMIMGRDDLLYVTQWDGKVVRFDLDGNFVDEFTSINIPAGLGMTWDEDDNLYVAAWGTNGFDGQVFKFDSDGNSMGSFINSSILDGPTGIWQGEDGDFFVVDWRKGAVFRFDNEGNYKEDFITGLVRIEGQAFGQDGSIFICEVQNNRVQKFNSDGTFSETFITGASLAGPNDIVFGPMPVNTENAFDFEINMTVSPNPFSEITIIEFELPSSENINLNVRNSAGHEVLVLKEGTLNSGKHQFEWKAEGMPGGTYFIHLKNRK